MSRIFLFCKAYCWQEYRVLSQLCSGLLWQNTSLDTGCNLSMLSLNNDLLVHKLRHLFSLHRIVCYLEGWFCFFCVFASNLLLCWSLLLNMWCSFSLFVHFRRCSTKYRLLNIIWKLFKVIEVKQSEFSVENDNTDFFHYISCFTYIFNLIQIKAIV